ncbi:MAG TPA: dihydrodipicolinate synthase family protein, partial [Chitinophagaceae bacterium]|nr:dihydrodipicolinate synthase family protein [Chitinophagaceae bacterium]
MNFEWKGVFPALLTPFTQDDQLDILLFEKNLQAQLDAGVSGVIIGGSLGEASTITSDEKEKLVKAAVNYVKGRIPVLMNIAECTTKDAVA